MPRLAPRGDTVLHFAASMPPIGEPEETIRVSVPHPAVEVWHVANSRRLWRVFHESYTVCNLGLLNGDRPGRTEWRYRGKAVDTPTGELMLMEPGELHVTRAYPGPGAFGVAFIQPAFVEAIAAQAGMRGGLHLKQTRSRYVFAAFERLHAAVRAGAGAADIEAGLYAGVLRLVETCSETAAPATNPDVGLARIRRVVDYIHAFQEAPIRLGELARVAGVSEAHLCRAFQRTLGLSPLGVQRQFRLERARADLRAGRPIAEIDGFYDASHLTRHFKRTFGFTPAGYAASVRPRAPADGP